MTSLKERYLRTHVIEKSEKIKMSTRNNMDDNKEEEQMVARVEGRGRSLVQALIRVRRERAGRAPQNLQVTQDIGMRPSDTGGGSTWSVSGKETRKDFRQGGEEIRPLIVTPMTCNRQSQRTDQGPE